MGTVHVFPVEWMIDGARLEQPLERDAEIVILPVVRVERPAVRRGRKSLLPPVLPRDAAS